MTKKYVDSSGEPIRKYPPATTPEGREDQLIALAMDVAEQRMRNGTATSQEVTHFLKAGSINSRLERDILKLNKELISAKTEALQSQKRVEELYSNALSAMRSYAGSPDGDETYED